MSESASVERETWEAYRARIDARLEEYLKLGEACPERLRRAMAYSLLAGGKRLRPLLVILANEACGGGVEQALPAACAVEMVHTYSLIHDDLPAMDDDQLRRGRPTNHVEFDEATAILAGDALLTLAFQILAEEIRPPEVAAACCAELAAAAGAEGMVGGQAADLAAEEATAQEPTATDVETLAAIHRRKTGRLLEAALNLGARVAGADQPTLEALGTYGRHVGLAFQIADDLLDIIGDRERMGKNVRRDADNGKLTYPALLGVSSSREKARSLVESACAALAPLGDRGGPLEALAQFVLKRDH